MAVRSTMLALIARTRLLVNDPAGTSQQFADQDYQDILDEKRQAVHNEPLEPRATFTGSTISWLDYYAPWGGFEDGTVLKQFLVNVVTPSLSEPIVGHWQFSTNTLPPIYATGAVYDIYGSAADLLERLAARWVLAYSVAVDGQSLQRSQAHAMLLDMAHQYRLRSRAFVISTVRSDTAQHMGGLAGAGLGPLQVDMMADGNGRPQQ